jgi:hypothetical protein
MRRRVWLGVAAGFAVAWVAIVAFMVDRSATLTDLRPLGDAIPWPAFAVVGSIILAHRPGNRIGALCIVAGVAQTLTSMGQVYVLSSLASATAWPLEHLIAWYGSWGWVVSICALLLVLLIFPTGEPANRGWRWVAWFLVAWFVASIAVGVPLLWPLSSQALVTGLDSATEYQLLDTMALILLPALLACSASLLLRLRRSSVAERAQIIWLLWAAALSLVVIVLDMFLDLESVRSVLSSGSLLAIPVAIGVAITRYRLFEIDRIVSRTVTYAFVALVLTAVYFAGAAALGALIGEANSLAVAGATLTAAALFSPVRRKVQRFVDRYFDRSRYDAGLVVDEFASRLRSEVDLGGLTRNLSDVVGQTLRPTTVRLWLRGDPRTVQATVRSADR